MDFAFVAFILAALGCFAIFIHVMVRIERLERWHHEDHELLDPDIRKKTPR